MQIVEGELFVASLAKLFRESHRPGILNSIRLHMRFNARRISVFFSELGEQQLRVARLYVGSDIGYLRIFFEIGSDKIVLWHVSQDARR